MVLLLSFLLLSSLILPSFVHADALQIEKSNSVNISAYIGQNRVTIDGYTSPNSRVELTSPRVYAITYSQDNGYFIFDRTILPRHPSDLCLSAIDNQNRQSQPVCVPPPPVNNYHTDIGPILLPPTISLENNTINPNSTVISSGQSIPNSQISLHFYKVNDKGLSFPKEAYAYSLPSLTIETDKEGNFNFSLPTAYASDYRLYASTKFSNNYSPKSNTLVYILPSLFSIFLQQNYYLVFLLPLYVITLIIFFTLLRFYLPERKKHLPALRNFLPAVKIK